LILDANRYSAILSENYPLNPIAISVYYGT
jgi:hypothetical protein